MIAIHEFGHFFTAKLFRVKVNEFAIGMGPTIWKKTKGETQYSLRALPIGGFCAMEGEDENSDDPRAFTSAKPWKKTGKDFIKVTPLSNWMEMNRCPSRQTSLPGNTKVRPPWAYWPQSDFDKLLTQIGGIFL
jgi:hypothetical protein